MAKKLPNLELAGRRPRDDRETVRSILVPGLPFPKEISSQLQPHEQPVDVNLIGKITEDSVDEGNERQHLISVIIPDAEREQVKERVERLEKEGSAEKWVLVYERTNFFVRANNRFLQKATIDVVPGKGKQVRTVAYCAYGRIEMQRNFIDGVLRCQKFTTYLGDSTIVIGFTQDAYDQKRVLLEQVIFDAHALPLQTIDSGEKPVWESTVMRSTYIEGKVSEGREVLATTSSPYMFNKFLEEEQKRQQALSKDHPLRDSYVPLVDQIRNGY